MSLPPRCRQFLSKRRQRGGCHYARSYIFLPRVLADASPWALLCRAVYITTFDSSAAAPFGENGY